MKPLGRVGDLAACPADAHGCTSCAHVVVGPATAGSPDVFVNGLPALRVGDPGTHKSCCGPNQWEAKQGADRVLINGKPAFRMGDISAHCGGVGKLISGSPNVIVGDEKWEGDTTSKSADYDEAFVLIYEGTSYPVANRKYRIIRANGELIEGVTDQDGRTLRVQTPSEEDLTIEILDDA